MKTTILIAFTLNILFSTQAHSHFNRHVIDWSAVANKSEEIRNGLFEAGKQEILEIATANNPAIGNILREKLDNASITGLRMLDQLSTPISAQNLTSSEADGILSEYLYYTMDLYYSLMEDLEQLSYPAEVEASGIFLSTVQFDSYTSNQIVFILGDYSLAPTNWTRVDSALTNLSGVIGNRYQIVVNLATEDNAEIGGRIAAEVNATVDKGKVLIEDARDFVTSQTWNLRASTRLIQDIENEMYKVEGRTSTDLEQLSATAKAFIRDQFSAAHREIFVVAYDINLAIAGLGSRVPTISSKNYGNMRVK